VEPVLDHDRGDSRDVVDLAAHHPGGRCTGQVGATAAARGRDMIDDLVRITDLHRITDLQQRRPARAGLFAGLAAAASPSRPRGRHPGPISRGRLRGISRVAAQPPLEFNDLGLQRLDRPGLRLDHREEFLTRRLLRPGHRP